jgi:Kef-type K+ transport system membrane component KefB
MEDTAGVLLDLFVIFVLAKVAAELFERLGQPTVVGELLVGVAIGPHALGIIDVPLVDSQGGLSLVYEVIAGLGLVILLFSVGLETRLDELLEVGPRALVVAAAGEAVTFALAAGFMAATGHATVESFFVGAAVIATSVGITARVLHDLGVLRSREARIILAAAVADDILALLVLTAVAQMGEGGAFDVGEVLVTAFLAVAFVGFAALVGTRVVQRYSLHLERLRFWNAPLAIALALMLGLSAAAAEIGLAGIIGAFLAGLMLAESREQLQLERNIEPIAEFLVPFFFVITGAKVDIGLLAEGDTLALALAITAIAIAGKVIACGASGYGLGPRSMAILGVGMTPRGEIGFIVASVGLAQGSIGGDIFSAVIFMSIATTLVVPPVLSALYAGRPVAPPLRRPGLPRYVRVRRPGRPEQEPG